jgi:hypothetical protein
MEIDEAKQILSVIPVDQHDVLQNAYNRYMHFTGVWCGDGFSEDQIAADRDAYPHFLKFTDDGRPALCDERCAAFMAAVSGLPVEWCFAWDAIEFEREHGDFDELVVKAEKLAESKAIEAHYGHLNIKRQQAPQ